MSAGRCVDNPDVLIIGAGVAGAAAAARVASLAPNATTVLIERSTWPRNKVCGCCLNPAGVRMLEVIGVGRTIREMSLAVDAVTLRSGRSTVAVQHPGGLAIGRSEMDRLLVDHAVSRGAAFHPGTSARVLRNSGAGWQVQLQSDHALQMITARVVLIADGLTGTSLTDLPEFAPCIARSSWIGLGAVTSSTQLQAAIPQAHIAMHTAPCGYAGLVRLPGDHVAIAAAAAPRFVRSRSSPAAAVCELLRACGVGLPMNLELPIRGTGMLTRRRRTIARDGLLVIGDAAGYVEPFTGEGMTWALAGALEAARLSSHVLSSSISPGESARSWADWHRQHIGARQQTCRAVRSLVHAPSVARLAIAIGSAVPTARRLIASTVARTSREYPLGAST